MNSPRLTALVPVLMILALPLGAGEAGKTPTAPPLTAEQDAFWKEFQNGDLSKAQADAEAKYVTARAAFQDARFVEAHELVDEAIRIFPSHAGSQQLREQVLAFCFPIQPVQVGVNVRLLNGCPHLLKQVSLLFAHQAADVGIAGGHRQQRGRRDWLSSGQCLRGDSAGLLGRGGARSGTFVTCL